MALISRKAAATALPHDPVRIDPRPMDILYLLIPLSALLVLGILVVFAWALNSGQFEDLSRQGQRILEAGDAFDRAQGSAADGGQESAP